MKLNLKELTVIFLTLVICVCMSPTDVFAVDPTPISSVTITGLTKPVAGQPVSTTGISVDGSERFKSVQLGWGCVDEDGIARTSVTSGDFEADEKYAFAVVLECNEEYIFENDTVFTIDGLTDGFRSDCVIYNSMSGSSMVTFTKESETAIDTINITGVTPPVLGATASFDFNIEGNEATLFEIYGQNILMWIETDAPLTGIQDIIHPASSTIMYETPFNFKYNKYYTFLICVRGNTGYSIENSTSTKINGIDAESCMAEEAAAAIGVYYTFPVVEKIKIDNITVTGLTKPVVGQPITVDGISVDGSERFLESQFHWLYIDYDGDYESATGNFETDKRYALGVGLECKDEYILENDVTINVDGLTSGFFSNVMADNNEMDGLIVFSKDSETMIDTVNITGVIPPALGAPASFDYNVEGSETSPFEKGGQKYSEWYETDTMPTGIMDIIGATHYTLGDSLTFEEDKYYTFVTGVIPNSGYGFDNNTVFKINGMDALAISEGAAIALFYTFPKVTSTSATEYNLWVGGTRVTSANAYNVVNDGTVIFDNETKMLTLNGYSNSSLFEDGEGDCAIYSDSMDLTIILADGSINNLSASGESGSDVFYYKGIYVSGGDLVIDGNGTLNIDTVTENQYSRGIAVYDGDCEIKNGIVKVESTGEGIYADTITFSGGTLYNKGEVKAFNIVPTSESPMKLSTTEDATISEATVWTTVESIEANFKLANTWTKLEQATSSHVTVNGSYAETTGEGDYLAGDTVTIDAGTRSGYTFNGWSSYDVTITDSSNSTATFIMPENAVTVKANWKQNASGGGSTGSGAVVTKFDIEVEVEAEEGGTAKATPSKVEKGENAKIKVSAYEGYEIEDVIVDGKSVGAVKEYEIKNIKDDVIVKVTFKKIIVNPVDEMNFIDVKPSDWFYNAVKFAVENKLMNGTSKTTFDPNATTTRAMVVTILYRLENEPVVTSNNIFDDVENDAWYTNAIIWASENGIVLGDGKGSFNPNGAITREQLVTILYRYANYKKLDTSVGEDTNILSYDDAFEISEYAIPAIQWASGEGLVSGVGENLLAPHGNATRAQIATIMMRFMGK